MPEKKNKKITGEKRRSGSILSFSLFLSRLRAFLKYWLIAAVLVAVINVAVSSYSSASEGKVSTIINFSFDGIESGLDPNGNKFDVNEIKSNDIIQQSLDKLGLNDLNAEIIGKHISVDGIVPSNVINRITQYTPMIGKDNVESSKIIQDTSYYPTQYKMEIEYSKSGLSKKEAANLLNEITNRYYNEFYARYGYNESLENAVKAIDYKDYDYIDAVDVFNTSLNSLKNYLNELESRDKTRFRADNGYTFADISASIDTICDEDLDWASSYISLKNVSRDKKTLIANYNFKIESLKRTKAVAQETIDTLEKTINDYEKNSILILGNSSDSTSATIDQSTDTYDNLIDQKLLAEKDYASAEQKISLYEKRIKALESSAATKEDNEIVEQQFEKISSKVDSLLKTANEAASQYYEKVLLNNAYTVLSPASDSFMALIKEAVSNSTRNIFIYEIILFSAYLSVGVIFCFVRFPKLSFRKSSKAGKKSK